LRIHFYCQNIKLRIPSQRKFKQWIKRSVKSHGKDIKTVSIIFCDDDYLLSLNKQFLKKDYLTDVITFDYADDDAIYGDVFISIDRVKENAHIHHISFPDELQRVLIHGILHLIGFKDHTEEEKHIMTKMENEMLKLY
jgi:rRNA maturation RNase YbeY